VILPLILGFLAGAAALLVPYANKRRQVTVVDEEKQRLEQEKQIVLEFMHNMVQAIGEGVTREALFQRIIHAAVLSTGAESACLYEKRSDGTLKGVAVEGLFPPQHELPPNMRASMPTRARFLEEILKSESFEIGEGLIGQTGRDKRPILIPDGTRDPRVIQHDDPSLKVRSLIVAPILFQDDLLGVLAVANPADGTAFDPTDFSLVESLAEQVGLAIHNCDMMNLQIEKNKLDLDLELASNIQGMLLPDSLPFSDRIDIASVYKPAQKIGGDLYDIFKLSRNRVGLAIADVTGKGIPASLLMAICQTNLRHFARRTDSPAEVLKAINAAMESAVSREMFITVIYAVVDLENESIVLARAGHELPFLITSEDGRVTVDAARSEGMALGMVPPEIFDRVIEDRTLPFHANNTLLLYTDGVTECTNESGAEFSGERLADHLKTSLGDTSRETVQRVVEAIDRFADRQSQTDDITLLAARHRDKG